MAINETKTYEGKRIPTAITIYGDEMDQAIGNITIGTGLRLADGSIMDRDEMGVYNLADELAFTDSNGTTGLAVMQYLAEWFEKKRGS